MAPRRIRPRQDVTRKTVSVSSRALEQGVAEVGVDPARAIALLESVLQEDPQVALAYRHLALAHIALGQHAAAISRLTWLRQRGQATADDLLALSESHRALGHDGQARALVQQAAGLDPRSPDAALTEARADMAADRLADAEVAYRRALDLAPDHPEALRGMGESALARGDLQSALHFFERAHARDPDDAAGTLRLAVVHARTGDVGSALPLFEAAVDALPENADALAGLAAALARTGRPAEAVPYFERAVHAGLHTPAVFNGLGFAKLESGDRAGALAALRSLARHARRPAAGRGGGSAAVPRAAVERERGPLGAAALTFNSSARRMKKPRPRRPPSTPAGRPSGRGGREHTRSAGPFRGRIVLALAIAAALLIAGGMVYRSTRTEVAAGGARQNILLITLDTTRADHLGSYGFTRARTRYLDRLAAEGVRFEWAFSPAPITLPAHASIFTGLYPFEHGVRNNGNFYLGETTPTLATVLAGAGYRTAAFVSTFVLDRRYGLARGFEVYDDRMETADTQVVSLEAERRGDRTSLAFSAWLDRYAAGTLDPPRGTSLPAASGESRAPFFAWLHLYDPHEPYRPPQPFRGAFPDSPYDGEIAFDDAIVASVLDKLRQLALLDSTVIAVIGDHGESLGDHGEETHSMFVYDAAVRVPLILWRPGRLPADLIVSRPVCRDRSPADAAGTRRRAAARRSARAQPAAAARGQGPRTARGRSTRRRTCRSST